tara:strand:+ start:1479 stop:2219 length:741 start_codon:yes stop_codon:yes gene_type:complete
MNIIKILLKKEFIVLKKSFIAYLMLFAISPLLLYLFLSIPLSYAFHSMKPIYMVWSSSGVWIVSSLFLVYLLHSMYLLNNYKVEYVRSLPILSYQYLFSGYIYGIVIGVIELIISIIVISSINFDYISFFNLLKIIFIFIPSVLIVCNISFFVVRFLYFDIYITISNIILLLLLSFGIGAFIPLNSFPESYSNIIQYLPIASTVYNIQKVVASEVVYFSMIFISIFYMVMFTLINYFIIENDTSNK